MNSKQALMMCVGIAASASALDPVPQRPRFKSPNEVGQAERKRANKRAEHRANRRARGKR